MGRYTNPVSRESAQPAAPEPICQSCGWDFRDEHTSVASNGRSRKDTRTEIHLPRRGGGVVVRCDDCYERELQRMGRGRYGHMTALEAWALSK